MTTLRRVVLLGFGAINTRVADLLRERKSRLQIVGVITRRGTASTLEGAVRVETAADLAALRPDLILEAASREAVREWGVAALRTARRFVVSSGSAFTDDRLFETLRRTAQESGSQLVLSPGAVAGVEALSAGSRLPLREVRHRIVKSPLSWGPAAQPHAAATAVVFFRGSAREAAERYPLNANVTVVSALASLGLDQTVVELVADPNIAANCHEIHAAGDFGTMTIKIENRPLQGNPKSSELAALALVRLAENEVAELVL